MEGRPITADSKHNYPSQPLWNRSTSSPSIPRLSTLANGNTDQVSTSQYLTAQVDWIPIFFPQQSSLYQAQLLQYNKLIAPGRGGGLQTAPLPPLLSTHSVHVGPRSRSSSKVSNKDSRARQSSQNCHATRGNHGASNKADRALITGRDTPPKMPPKKSDLSHTLAARPKPSTSPSNLPPHSNSVPSTPQQHARKFSFESRDHSPNANQSHSPRSAYSETNGALPSLRPLPPRQGGCRYESGLKFFRRRIPYSIGSDMLEKAALQNIKSKLSKEDEKKLTADMSELFGRLKPTKKVEDKRRMLVQKLEKLLNDAWPGHDIRVHLFGSSENMLCSDDSDVDICIVTPWKELEEVCMLADLLAKHGMQKVVCVSSAKVPIVKIWDPELELACDMNVNNTLALENTRMIKTYVQIDKRVQPLAMIIKYWTRRRIVNDAAYGGTLSSYTWICMIIAFLQLRQPPILPTLHQRLQETLPGSDSDIASFADDIDKLQDFGIKNKSTLGELLFEFFRFYAHEFDYSKDVLSVRLGKVISKKDKKWLFSMNNQLCVEEPFNTTRNLGNTADDTAFRGLHLELRRAFDLIAEGKLDECCEQYVYPKEEEKIFQKPPSVSRPVMLRSASQQQSNRGGRGGGFRGNRQQGQHRNNSNNNSRRTSSTVPYDTNGSPMFIPTGYQVAMTPQEAVMYMQPTTDLMAQTISALTLQENNLRFLQYAQSQAFHMGQMQGNASQTQPSSTERSRTNSFDTPPLSAPIRPEMYYYPMQFPQAFYAQQAFPTYPSSPSTSHAAEFRRSSHRSTAASEASHGVAGSAMRSQSQPASRTGIPTAQNLAGPSQLSNGATNVPARHINGIPMPSFIPDESHDNEHEGSIAVTPPEDERDQSYYADPSSPPRRTSATTSSIPAFGDIATQAPNPTTNPNQSRGRLSSDQLPQSILDRIKQNSRPPSPSLNHNRAYSVGRSSAPLASAPFAAAAGSQSRDTTPLVVNGSMSKLSNGSSPRQPSQSEFTSAQYAGYDNALHINQRLEANNFAAETSFTYPPGPSAPRKANSPTSDRPVVVNGSSNAASPMTNQIPGSQLSHDMTLSPAGNHFHMMNMSPVPAASDGNAIAPNSLPRFPIRSTPSPLIAQLDLATEHRLQSSEQSHLSPVYETNSPSPSFNRRLDLPFDQAPALANTVAHNQPDFKPESAKGKQKSPIEPPPSRLESIPLPNPRVNGLARENGHVRGVKSESDNAGSGWQKMTRGRKKGNDTKPRSEVYPQSEQLPKNDSERKGG
ncbi:uncharacterized protein GGS22DRAFT_27175 [Annulohypoxylon maeteangense]|uniref:uncharacterized protein n=1 Tax=Annulohypoxylon maeteangense TaxID=1927788 RepID=UPI002008296E|nr:uncharacterized protein GGS22DRAFT_27175 [Annulohypoxylon maeteangense]KAI0883897.1 hypothetical protein GGS22DRAFT_27175 [Annulohypoxylon maeteangense]